jgi:hypothetical protein
MEHLEMPPESRIRGLRGALIDLVRSDRRVIAGGALTDFGLGQYQVVVRLALAESGR